MKRKYIVLLSGSTFLALGACVVPPSLLERASWGPPQERWQDQGRYRQAGHEESVSDPVADAQSARATAIAERRDSPLPGAAQPDAQREAAPGEAPLYSWDGGVVDGAPQGRVTAQDGTPRGLETPPAGRMHIIELYQAVLDERDSLATEVERLRKGLQETTLALEAKTRATEELSARVAALEASYKELSEDNQSIAARLVQAQIRRLEAEKMLLETKLEMERAKAEEAATAAAAQQRSLGKKPAPKKDEGHE